MAMQIAKAIIAYKNEYFGQERNNMAKYKSKEIASIKSEANEKVKHGDVFNDNIYKVQLFAASKKIQLDSNKFKGLKNISSLFNNNIYRYMYGETSNFDEANKMQIEAKKTGFSDAYIVVVKDGKSTKVNDTVKQ
jgi:N-acetylmuramoyl-L-alanine amidase